MAVSTSRKSLKAPWQGACYLSAPVAAATLADPREGGALAGPLFVLAAAPGTSGLTYRILRTAQARLAFAAGEHPYAYRLLRDNIRTLLDRDYTDVTRMIAIESSR